MTTRREFIRDLLAGGVVAAVAPRLFALPADLNAWDIVPSILMRIKPG